ncbi:MAG: PIN domain-containing protein [Holophagales bacterium]|nr:PIN domain-containing protein [Holophagales bacterium]MBK9965028.1 PIN domain-containing protein [Holophagales bacterium]
MRVYLDLCCLKRPFDLQDQPIVRLQTEAVLSILALPSSRIDLVRCPAHLLENSLNPVAARRDAVSLWLSNGPITRPPEAGLSARIATLVPMGFRSFDAFHLASAELSGAVVFVTVDLRLLKIAGRFSGQLSARVTDPLRLVEEIVEWTH